MIGKELERISRIYKLKQHNVHISYRSYVSNFCTIGPWTKINGGCFLSASKKAPLSIGKYCAIAHNFRVRTRNHSSNYANIQFHFAREYNFSFPEDSRGRVRIGNACWIGDNVLILPGVEIGDGCIIGAGSVVTKSLEPYSVACGVPSKTIRRRFDPSIIEELMKYQWWDWPVSRIKKNKKFFELDLTKISARELVDIIL